MFFSNDSGGRPFAKIAALLAEPSAVKGCFYGEKLAKVRWFRQCVW
jgi:hypothetical protein